MLKVNRHITGTGLRKGELPLSVSGITAGTHATFNPTGFTLIELLLAMSIFVLVLGTIYGTLYAGIEALKTGQDSMQVYQTNRSGLNFLLRDLRKSLSPSALPYREQEDPLAEEEEIFVEDEPTLQITFKGSRETVQITVRQEMDTQTGPSLDIREISYLVEDNQLIKNVYRSLLTARVQDLLNNRRQMQGGEEQQEYVFMDNPDGYFEDEVRIVICDSVRSVEFSYYDGEVWEDNWDSEQEYVSPYSSDLPEEELEESDYEMAGLPQLVRVDLAMTNGRVLHTATDIPSSDLNPLGLRQSESGFGPAAHGLLARNRQRERRARERGVDVDWLRGRRASCN